MISRNLTVRSAIVIAGAAIGSGLLTTAAAIIAVNHWQVAALGLPGFGPSQEGPPVVRLDRWNGAITLCNPQSPEALAYFLGGPGSEARIAEGKGAALYQTMIDGGAPVDQVDRWKKETRQKMLDGGADPKTVDAYWNRDPPQMVAPLANLLGVGLAYRCGELTVDELDAYKAAHQPK